MMEQLDELTDGQVAIALAIIVVVFVAVAILAIAAAGLIAWAVGR